jgi:hypothetical protein
VRYPTANPEFMKKLLESPLPPLPSPLSSSTPSQKKTSLSFNSFHTPKRKEKNKKLKSSFRTFKKSDKKMKRKMKN